MKIAIQESFIDDLKTIRDGALRSRAMKAVDKLAAAATLQELVQVKQLKGSKDAFRFRVGDYRLGFILIGDVVHVSCFLHRKEVYRHFP